MKFTKDNKTCSLQVRDSRVMTSIVIGENRVSNPSLELFLSQGWEIFEELPVQVQVVEPKPYIPTRSEVIEQYIREHGYPTYGAELAVLNNYAENPSEYLDEWQTYMSVRHAAKAYADTIETIEDNEPNE